MSLQKNAFCAWCQVEKPHNVAYDNLHHTFELTCDGFGMHVIRISGNATKDDINAILDDHAEVFKGWEEPKALPPHAPLADLFNEEVN